MISILHKDILRIAYAIYMLFGIHALHASPFVYVANDGDTTVSVIDAATNLVVATVDIEATPYFNALAVSYDNTTVYVGCTDNTIRKIDVATNTYITPNITLPSIARALTVTPDNLYLYAGCANNNAYKIKIANGSNAVVTPAGDLDGIQNLGVTTDNVAAYAIDYAPATAINPINIATNSLHGNLALASCTGLAITPNNQYIYTCDPFSLHNFQASIASRFSPIITNTITLSFGYEPSALAVTSDGDTLYVLTSNNSLVPFDISNPASPVIGTILALESTSAYDLTILPDNSALYISDLGSNNVLVVDITNRLTPVLSISPIPVGSSPKAIVATPAPIPPIPPLINPPASVTGCKTQNVFLLQTELINKITWTPPTTGNTPVQYKIYRDAALTEPVATVPAAGSLEYYDHNRQPNIIDSYYIISIDANGNRSIPSSVTVTTSCS